MKKLIISLIFCLFLNFSFGNGTNKNNECEVYYVYLEIDNEWKYIGRCLGQPIKQKSTTFFKMVKNVNGKLKYTYIETNVEYFYTNKRINYEKKF